MASRAIHLEVAHSLKTDSFINDLRRFICRRGPIRQMRSDHGTNFVGAKKELKEALSELDQDNISKELLQDNCDWFSFKMNVFSASHMGGVWERQIRSVRSVLSVLLDDKGTQLDDASLSTFICEADAIINSRPLTVDDLRDPDSLSPLTPNHLLTMKSKIVLPPPGNCQDADKYSRRRWRRIQHLANEFWCRWKKEFLQSLQLRQTWLKPQRDQRPTVMRTATCAQYSPPCRSLHHFKRSAYKSSTTAREANTQAGVADDRQRDWGTRIGVYPRQGAVNFLCSFKLVTFLVKICEI